MNAAAGPSRAAIPAATYRLQLNAQFTFADAASLVPYLHRLGISHLYLSPFLAARAGSVHGYDITDHNAFNAELGGEEGFRRLADAVAGQGLGMILDFVPNHMGVARADNPWWLDLLEWGESSPYASYFDVDWHPLKPELRGKVLLPFLGEPYGAALEAGELRLAFDAPRGAFDIWYHDHRFPVTPGRYRAMLERAAQHVANREAAAAIEEMAVRLRALGARADSAPRRAAQRRLGEEVKAAIARLCAGDADIAGAFDAAAASFNGTAGDPASFRDLHRLLEGQAYRLAHWRVATREINYRRFFDINDLAGLRIETPALFEDAHRLVFRLIAEGHLHGLRIDHIDGLYDPAGYCESLQRHIGTLTGSAERGPFYVLVEKILAHHEHLRESWPIAGTTGYEFASLVNGLFVDPAAEALLTRIYTRFVGDEPRFDELLYACKKQVMESTLAAELEVLANMADRLSESSWTTRDFTRSGLRAALVEIVASFPVYRTYVTAEGATADDRRDIDWAIGAARRRNPSIDPSVFDFLHDLMSVDLAAPRLRGFSTRAVAHFAMKLQQYTGPVMAKAMEDTAFYRYHRLVSLNEVGGDPRQFATTLSAFHRQNEERRRRWPQSMLTTATHDTKRGEDVRVRIDALSERADAWRLRVRRWATLNRRRREMVDDAPAPTPNDEYLLYQTLVGAWPLPAGPPAGKQTTEADAGIFADRIVAYMTKAIREAKRESSWAQPNAPYEAAVERFVRAILARDRPNPFLADFVPFQAHIARIGAINGLAQAALRLTVPGVPDTYRGCELWDLSLVDPDNRRPVDWATRLRMLDELDRGFAPGGPSCATLLRSWQDGRVKLYVLSRLLRLRSADPALFAEGSYLPLAVEGPRQEHVCAFARIVEDRALIVAVPRLVASLLPEYDLWPPPADVWDGTVLRLPATMAGRRCVGLFDGAVLAMAPGDEAATIPAATLFGRFPVAALLAEPPAHP